MSLDRRTFLATSAIATATMAWPATAATTAVEIHVETRRPIGGLPHIWEECVGSDRAAITLRESWRKDLDRGKSEAGFKRVRFHGILNDELGVYAPSILNHGEPRPNFQNVDQVYDGLVERSVDPFVEVSFMPKQLASGNQTFGFYAANVTPPVSMDTWANFIKIFVGHLADRYGLGAVRRWPFEVWNEPDLGPFWAGTQQQYFELYKATAVAIKSIDLGISVGGPATSGARWIPEFSAWCAQNNAPVDFFTTHMYAGGRHHKLPVEGPPEYDVIPEAVRRARAEIDNSAFKGRPLWLTEWSSDSPAMIAHIIKNCLPNCHAMSQWELSSTYEELGVSEYLFKENATSWGMLVQGIAKPSFNTYKLLHRLGSVVLDSSGPVLASARDDGSIAVLCWNLADVTQASGVPWQTYTRTVIGDQKRFNVEFGGGRAGQSASVYLVDQERGAPLPAWRKLGAPQYIEPADLELLRHSADIPPPMTVQLDSNCRVTIDLPPEGLALIELV